MEYLFQYKDMVNLLSNSDSEVLFYGEKYEKYIEQFKKDLPNIKYYIGLNREEDEENVLSYDKFKELGKKEYELGNKTYVDLEKKDLNELRMLVYTSGTTGVAKGVMLSEHNLVSSVYYGLQVADVETKCLSVLPYHHTYEAVSGILVGIHYHVTICINDSLKNVLKNLQLYKPDYIYLVPAFTEVFYKNIWNKVKKEGKEINLTKKEYDTLLLFARNPGNVLFREIIYERVWGGDYIAGSRTVDLHVQRVRKKVGWEDFLITVPKMGYRLEIPR